MTLPVTSMVASRTSPTLAPGAASAAKAGQFLKTLNAAAQPTALSLLNQEQGGPLKKLEPTLLDQLRTLEGNTLPVKPLDSEGTTGQPSPQDLRQTFDQFVGEVYFGQLMQSMRKSLGKPAYFHGGQGEEMFTQQLDQALVQEMTKADAHGFTGAMFEAFQLNQLA